MARVALYVSHVLISVFSGSWHTSQRVIGCCMSEAVICSSNRHLTSGNTRHRLVAQAGNLYENYDAVTSTEGFYAGISNSSLKFVPPSKDPPKIKDNVSERTKCDYSCFGREGSARSRDALSALWLAVLLGSVTGTRTCSSVMLLIDLLRHLLRPWDVSRLFWPLCTMPVYFVVPSRTRLFRVFFCFKRGIAPSSFSSPIARSFAYTCLNTNTSSHVSWTRQYFEA